MAHTNLTYVSTLVKNFGRLDAEFFRKEYLSNDELLDSIGYKKLRVLTKKIDVGHVGTMVRYYADEGVPLLQTKDISGFFIDTSTCVKVTRGFHERLRKSQVYPGDILIARSGSFGTASIYLENEVINSADIIITQVKDELMNRFFAVAYLNSKYGSIQLIRFASGGLQGHVNLTILAHLRIPIVKRDKQDEIGKLVEEAYYKERNSKALFSQATRLLNVELGLDQLQFENPRSYEAMLSEVISSKRANAEFFDPDVRRIITSKLMENATPISSLFEIIRGKTPVKYSRAGIPVLKTKCIRVPEIDKKKVQDFSVSKRGLTLLHENDLVFAAMGVGSLGRISYANKIDQEYLVDSTLRLLRKKKSVAKKIEIPTLLFLSSTVGQKLIYRGIVGSTGIISLPDNYLASILIPNLGERLCNELTNLVIKSLDSKNESIQLLAQATGEIEKFIEQSLN